jgi:hypothetical protein
VLLPAAQRLLGMLAGLGIAALTLKLCERTVPEGPSAAYWFLGCDHVVYGPSSELS